ncbi:MAG TPA: hypothetical protein VK795_06305 [Terriglobales bacterium]|jgi:hypothetical protein|nr:hypothetical protein [Terriglobales bacterium]
MKNAARITVLILLVTMVSGTPRAGAQDGSIQFVARATPSSGVEEPVRGFPFYLLSRSFEEIEKEVAVNYPKPDMDGFIDSMTGASKQLRAWMKKNHWVQLSGEDFVKKLDVDDVMNVPEFFDAYVERMSGDQTTNFPEPKYKPAQQKKDPAKYDQLKAEYREQVRQFLVKNPKSTDGMDLNLEDIDPFNRWTQVQAKSLPDIQRRMEELAQSKYLVAHTQTDVEGQGVLAHIPPGKYWISSLELAASVGDTHLRWDTPISVRPGQPTYVTLSNANAVQPSHTSAFAK